MQENKFTNEELDVIGGCLRATVEGPFFPEWEFHALFGFHRSEIAEVLDQWPNVDWSDGETLRAIANSMNILLGYPHGKEEDRITYTGVSGDEQKRVLKKLLQIYKRKNES